MKNLKTLSIILITLIIFSGCVGTQYRKGVASLKRQNYPEAIDSFKAVLEENPEYPDARTQLGIVYYKAQMYEQAIFELEAVNELQSSDKRAKLFLGMAYLRQGNKENAIIEWSSYLEMHPSEGVSEQLKNSITVLKSSEILPETVDLITGSIENIIEQEDEIRDKPYYYPYHYGYRGHFPCD
jgi:tetratricopeptide (TPR) repeat protein